MTEKIKRVAQEPFIQVTATLRLNEVELRALKVLSDYSSGTVLDGLYKVVGERELRTYASGVHSLIDLVRNEVQPILRRADAARAAFTSDSGPGKS